MFFWMSTVQTYDKEEWNYMENLKKFVRRGFRDDGEFIDAVSGIVNRGCHNPPCGTGELDGGQERKENFKSEYIIRCIAILIVSLECSQFVSLQKYWRYCLQKMEVYGSKVHQACRLSPVQH